MRIRGGGVHGALLVVRAENHGNDSIHLQIRAKGIGSPVGIYLNFPDAHRAQCFCDYPSALG